MDSCQDGHRTYPTPHIASTALTLQLFLPDSTHILGIRRVYNIGCIIYFIALFTMPYFLYPHPTPYTQPGQGPHLGQGVSASPVESNVIQQLYPVWRQVPRALRNPLHAAPAGSKAPTISASTRVFPLPTNRWRHSTKHSDHPTLPRATAAPTDVTKPKCSKHQKHMYYTLP